MPAEIKPDRTYKGDALDLSRLPNGRYRCCVTSPPFFGKRANGNDPREIGRATLDDYVKETLEWCYQVGDKLTPDGLLFLNIGDTSSKSGGAGGDHNKGGSKATIPKYRQGRTGLAPKQSCLVPQRLALALQDQGWLVVRDIIWNKGSKWVTLDDDDPDVAHLSNIVKPEDVRHVRRPLEAYEHILMLALDPKHFYNWEAHKQHGIELGDVWHFPPYKGPRIGLAPFPEELPRRAILLGSEPGDWILDPFHGSGQTGRVATKLGRHWTGVELYAKR